MVSDFGAEVWGKNEKIPCKPLQNIQNQALVKIAGSFRTTTIAGLEMEMGILPVDVRLENLH